MGEHIKKPGEPEISRVHIAASRMVELQLGIGSQRDKAEAAQAAKDDAFEGLNTWESEDARSLAEDIVVPIRKKQKDEAERRSEEMRKERIRRQDETLREEGE